MKVETLSLRTVDRNLISWQDCRQGKWKSFDLYSPAR